MARDRFEEAVQRATWTGDWSEVITSYMAAAEGAAEAFYLTHAYVHALEAADPRAPALKAQLVALGADVI